MNSSESAFNPNPSSPAVADREKMFGDAGFWATTLLAIFGALIWGYWPTIVDLVREWQRNQDYSVGQLVPLVAIYLVWNDRRKLGECAIQPSWMGVGLIAVGQLMRGYGLLFMVQSAERYSLVVTIAGLVLLVAGWQVFYRLRWVLLFLLLMVPLPGRMHNVISGPLQSQSTTGAVYFLELFGVSVVREGNVIVLNDSILLAVAEACSGLRMLTAFVVVAATFAYVISRPRWKKAVLLFSSIPVAIICNLFRLFITAQLFMVADSKTAETFFHDFAGLTMMPLAVLILVGELILMDAIVPEETQPSPVKESLKARIIKKRKKR